MACRTQNFRASGSERNPELPDLNFFGYSDNHPCNFPPWDQCSRGTSSNTIQVWSSVILQCLLMTWVSSLASASFTSLGRGNIEMRTNGISNPFPSELVIRPAVTLAGNLWIPCQLAHRDDRHYLPIQNVEKNLCQAGLPLVSPMTLRALRERSGARARHIPQRLSIGPRLRWLES